MIYVLAVVSGIVGSAVAFILFVIATAFMISPPEGVAEIGINLLGPMPLAVVVVGFLLGSALVLKFSN